MGNKKVLKGRAIQQWDGLSIVRNGEEMRPIPPVTVRNPWGDV